VTEQQKVLCCGYFNPAPPAGCVAHLPCPGLQVEVTAATAALLRMEVPAKSTAMQYAVKLLPLLVQHVGESARMGRWLQRSVP
jgi:hypothetical protein